MLEAIYIFVARDLIFLFVAASAIAFIAVPRKKKVDLLKFGTLSAGIAFALSRIAGLVYYNPRPFVVDGVVPLIPHAPNNGFPSDHALLGFTLAGIAYSYNRTAGIAVYCVATLISTSRVLLGIHSSVDILGSLVLSVIAVMVAKLIVKKIKDKKTALLAIGIGIITLATVGASITLASSRKPSSHEDTPATEVVSTSAKVTARKTLGFSEEGRPVNGYDIGNGENCIFMFGGIHGNEQGTVELLQNLADEIIAKPDLLASSKRLVIVPLLNPDGYSGEIYRNNARGVNLNRNFATTDWVQYPDRDTFAGTEPFSESESRVVQTIVEECKPSAMLAFHSQGAVVSPEAGSESMALAEWYIAKTGYTYFNDWHYPGTATAWFTETTGKPAITVEITNHEESDWEINKGVLLELLGENVPN